MLNIVYSVRVAYKLAMCGSSPLSQDGFSLDFNVITVDTHTHTVYTVCTHFFSLFFVYRNGGMYIVSPGTRGSRTCRQLARLTV